MRLTRLATGGLACVLVAAALSACNAQPPGPEMTLSSDGEPPTTRWELESLTISGTPQDKGSWDFIEIASPIQDGALIVTGGVCNTPQFTITKAVANEWSVEKTDVEDSSVCPKDRLPLKRLAIKVLSGNLAVAQTTSELVLTNGDAVATFKR